MIWDIPLEIKGNSKLQEQNDNTETNNANEAEVILIRLKSKNTKFNGNTSIR